MRLGGARRVGSASLVVLVGMVAVSRPKIIMKRGEPHGKAGTRTSGVEVAADEDRWAMQQLRTDTQIRRMGDTCVCLAEGPKAGIEVSLDPDCPKIASFRAALAVNPC